MTKKVLFAVLVAVLVLGFATTPVLAGGKANGHRATNGSTITLDQPDPHFGNWVTFTVATEASNDWVNARCYQGGQLVYAQWQEVIDHSAGVFALGPTPSWTGGAAQCVADVVLMGNGGNRARATTSFDVAP